MDEISNVSSEANEIVNVLLKISKLANAHLDNSRTYIQGLATRKGDSALKDVTDEAILNDPDKVMQALYDCDFSPDVYYTIGENDGCLRAACDLFNLLKNTDKAKECLSWVYHE
jgi:hypothetical protein